MKSIKRYACVAFTTIVLLSSFWLAQLSSHAQSSTSEATSAATQNLTFTPPARDITLTGQIIPAINTGPNAGYGFKFKDHAADQFTQPIEYHLYETDGTDVTLSFDSPSVYDYFWQKYLKEDPSYVNLTVTKEPDELPRFQKDITYTYLWREWAGQEVSLTGYFIQPLLFQVKSFQTIPEPTANSPSISPSLTGTPSSGQSAKRVTVIGKIAFTGINSPGVQVTTWYAPDYLYYLTDVAGNTVPILIFDQPNISPLVLDLQGNHTHFDLIDGKWAKFTGWILIPPSKWYWSNVKPVPLEAQIIQEMVPPDVTSTPNP